mmetsp:Transcript_127374/g.354594  ORF Transcript_127374/g.354594 Transcript_127374/m.354594 type:complete len:233 (+) Transcript_127374:159-857(+)
MWQVPGTAAAGHRRRLPRREPGDGRRVAAAYRPGARLRPLARREGLARSDHLRRLHRRHGRCRPISGHLGPQEGLAAVAPAGLPLVLRPRGPSPSGTVFHDLGAAGSGRLGHRDQPAHRHHSRGGVDSGGAALAACAWDFLSGHPRLRARSCRHPVVYAALRREGFGQLARALPLHWDPSLCRSAARLAPPGKPHVSRHHWQVGRVQQGFAGDSSMEQQSAAWRFPSPGGDH